MKSDFFSFFYLCLSISRELGSWAGHKFLLFLQFYWLSTKKNSYLSFFHFGKTFYACYFDVSSYGLATKLTLFFVSMIVICPSMEGHQMRIQKRSIPATILKWNGSSLRVLWEGNTDLSLRWWLAFFVLFLSLFHFVSYVGGEVEF